MAVPEKLRQRLEMTLGGGQGRRGGAARLLDDARRLAGRVQQIRRSNPRLAVQYGEDEMELACLAMHLPLLNPDASTQLGKRCEAAAAALGTIGATGTDGKLIQSAVRLLLETLERSPSIDDAKLLADAVNLEDFGVTGLLRQAGQLERQGEGLTALLEGCDKREQYAYWQARLREFHFDTSRIIARNRLEHYRKACQWLKEEVRDMDTDSSK